MQGHRRALTDGQLVSWCKLMRVGLEHEPCAVAGCLQLTRKQ